MAEKTLADIGHDAWHRHGGTEGSPPIPLSTRAPEYQEAWHAAADAIVEACAQAIKEVEAELAAEGEVYILVKTVEAIRSLKRSDKTDTDDLCQAKSSAQGETVSAPPLQATDGADAREPNSDAEWELEQSAFLAANTAEVPDWAREIIKELWREVCAREEWKAEAWQPIETAPSDGRRILIYSAKYPSGHKVQHGLADGEFWRREKVGPSHWMPLPREPKAKIEEPANAGDEVTAQHAEGSLTHKINQDQDNG